MVQMDIGGGRGRDREVVSDFEKERGVIGGNEAKKGRQGMHRSKRAQL